MLLKLITVYALAKFCWASAPCSNFTSTRDKNEKYSWRCPAPSYVVSSEYGKTNRTIIRVPWSNTYDSPYLGFIGPVCPEAGSIALDQLRAMPNWLPNYEIVIDVFDDICSDAFGTFTFVTKMRENDNVADRFPAYLAPDCGYFAQIMSALLAKPLNIIALATVPQSSIYIHPRSPYSNFYSAAEANEYHYDALAEFMLKIDLRKAAVLSEIEGFTTMMDGYLMDRFENRSVEIVYIAKVSNGLNDDREMRDALEETKRRDPRAIVIQAVHVTHFVCYLHAYGMYGPAYVIFNPGWNYIYDDPPSEIPWCTRKMIFEVKQSVIQFSAATLDIMYGADFLDSSGFSNAKLMAELNRRVDHIENTICPGYCGPLCYDKVFLLGALLDATETLLQQRGETLSDWTTNSRNFKENGHEIVKIMKKALSMVNITALKGFYRFDAETEWTSGSTPVQFYQFQKSVDGQSLQSPLVAYYVSFGLNRMTILNDALKWMTRSGKPPVDQARHVSIQESLINVTGQATMKIMAVIALLPVLFYASLAVFKKWIKNPRLRISLGVSDVANYFGVGVMLIAVLIIPSHAMPPIETANLCYAYMMLVFSGFTLSITGISWKLRTVKNRKNQPQYRIIKFFNENLMKARIFIPLWSGFLTVLFGVVLIASPIKTVRVESRTEILNDMTDIEHYYYYECAVPEAIFMSNTPLGLMIAIFCLHGYRIAATAIAAAQIQFIKKSNVPLSIRRTSLGFFCMFSVIGACALVAVLGASDNAYLLIVVSACIVIVSFVNSAVVAFAKFPKSLMEEGAKSGKKIGKSTNKIVPSTNT